MFFPVSNSGPVQRSLDLQQSQNEELVRQHLPQQVIDLLKPRLGDNIGSWKLLSLSMKEALPYKLHREGGVHLVHPPGADDLVIIWVVNGGEARAFYYEDGRSHEEDHEEDLGRLEIELGKLSKGWCVVL